MCTELDGLSIPLPKDWTDTIRSAILNIIGLLRIGMLTGREFLIREGDVLHAKVLRLEAEVSMLREELRINGTRMRRIDPHRRPQYAPVERMAILELRAMRGWNKAEIARSRKRDRFDIRKLGNFQSGIETRTQLVFMLAGSAKWPNS